MRNDDDQDRIPVERGGATMVLAVTLLVASAFVIPFHRVGGGAVLVVSGVLFGLARRVPTLGIVDGEESERLLAFVVSALLVAAGVGAILTPG